MVMTSEETEMWVALYLRLLTRLCTNIWLAEWTEKSLNTGHVV